jgi:hypothetical protein
MIKLYGLNSEQARGAEELLNDMKFGERFISSASQAERDKKTDDPHFADKGWDRKLFGPLGLQRKLAKIHVDPLDGLISESDNQLLINFLKDELLKIGAQAKKFDTLRHCDRVIVYAHLCDNVSSLLMIYSTVRKTEVEGLTKVNWANGIQHDPVNSKYFNIGTCRD